MAQPAAAAAPLPPKAQPPAGISHLGAADSTAAGRVTDKKLFNKYLEGQDFYSNNYDAITALEANDTRLYGNYAVWLLDAKKTDGESYAMNSISGFLRGAAQLLKEKHGGEWLDKLDAPNNWMTQMARNTEGLIITAAYEHGLQVVNAADSLTLPLLLEVVTAYRKCGHADAAKRALALQLVFMAGGRGGEVAAVTWSLLQWDPLARVLIINWREFKKNKSKMAVLLPARSDPDGDIYRCMADAAAHGIFNAQECVTEYNVVLLPRLSSTKLSQFLQDLVVGSKAVGYSAYRVASLEPDKSWSSHSLRHGALETAESNGVDRTHRHILSGHAMTSGKKSSADTASTGIDSYDKVTSSSAGIGASRSWAHAGRISESCASALQNPARAVRS